MIVEVVGVVVTVVMVVGVMVKLVDGSSWRC